MAKKAECLNFGTTRTSDTLTQPVHRAFIHSVLRNRCTSKTTAQGAKIEEEIKTSLRIQWVSVRKSGWSTASLGRQNKPVMRENGGNGNHSPHFLAVIPSARSFSSAIPVKRAAWRACGGGAYRADWFPPLPCQPRPSWCSGRCRCSRCSSSSWPGACPRPRPCTAS